jgi:hypothetical protein
MKIKMLKCIIVTTLLVLNSCMTLGLSWEWGNKRAHQFVHKIFSEVAPTFSTLERPAVIKEDPDRGHIELRGIYFSRPTRFSIWMEFGSFWVIEMATLDADEEYSLNYPYHDITINRDFTKKPKNIDPNDPWSVDDQQRIFLAPGIFFEEHSSRMGASIAFWNSLPKFAQERILRDMERLDMRALRWKGHIVSIRQRPGLSDLDDPVAYIKDCADLLHFFIEAAKKAGLVSDKA